MYTVSKRFTFEAAHRLSHGYAGKCAEVHGHSYKVDVVLGSAQLDEVGMVVDFSELQAFQEWLDTYFDHKLLLSQEDPLWVALQALKPNQLPGLERVVPLVGNPTAETMAFLFAGKLTDLFAPTLVDIVEVHVWETEKCCGSWRASNGRG
jgi:6-pyruvoyltetrahydropterin/6-carboxytetrahydropterin synthase